MRKEFISEFIKERNPKGFTLIELLVVIVIIAILAAVIFVALDPIRRFAEARNDRRWNDVNTILTAVHEYIIDNRGAMPTGLTAPMAETQLGTDAAGCTLSNGGNACGTVTACLDLSTPLEAYVTAISPDPSTGTAGKTAYSAEVRQVGTSMLITVRSCDPERGETIMVAR